MAAHWLGALHLSARQTRGAEILPERGPAYYLELMHKARGNILQNLANPVMMPIDIELLRRILTQMDVLESNWEKLLKSCEGIPQTLIHGDFRPKNIHVKQTPAGDVLYAMDWETAGWGIPLVDLAPSRGLSPGAQVNVPIYLSIVQEFWQNLDLPTLQYFVHVGRIFRRLAAMYWSSLGLSYRWLEEPIQSMQIFHKELAQAMTDVFGRS